MGETIQLGEIVVVVRRKSIKNVHLSVHPPDGHVTLVAPRETRPEAVRAYVVSKLSWIRAQRATLLSQWRETPRRFIERESHYLWGRRYLLSVTEENVKPAVVVGHRQINLTVRPGTTLAKREAIMHEWHKSLLHEAVPGLIKKWEPKLGVKVSRYFLQRMKTKWGGCNWKARNIRLNTELVKKPKDLLEYVLVHEMLHLHEPTHSERFVMLLFQHYSAWPEARAELNELALGAETWAGNGCALNAD